MTSQTHSLAGTGYNCGAARRHTQPAGKRGSLVATAIAAVVFHAALIAMLTPVAAAVAVGVAVAGVALTG